MDVMPTPSGGKADAERASKFEQCEWIATPQPARELGVSRRTLGRWLRSG
jgi:hypothetical protein